MASTTFFSSELLREADIGGVSDPIRVSLGLVAADSGKSEVDDDVRDDSTLDGAVVAAIRLRREGEDEGVRRAREWAMLVGVERRPMDVWWELGGGMGRPS